MFKLALWPKEFGHMSGRNVITVEEMSSAKVAGGGPSSESFIASFRAAVEPPLEALLKFRVLCLPSALPLAAPS